MDNLDWIKDLVQAERKMEESGIIDLKSEFDADTSLRNNTVNFLNEIKNRFVASASAFNQFKGATLGRIKIYGISKTEADFMIFRYGYKLIFSMREPGKIAVTFNHVGTSYIPGEEIKDTATNLMENILIAKWGAFGNLLWTHNELEIQPDYLVRHYLSRFIRESVREV